MGNRAMGSAYSVTTHTNRFPFHKGPVYSHNGMVYYYKKMAVRYPVRCSNIIHILQHSLGAFHIPVLHLKRLRGVWKRPEATFPFIQFCG
jgi:hypothetical protein